MRKWLMAAAIMLAASTTLMAQGNKSLPQRIGFVNLKKVLDSLPVKDSAVERLNEISQGYQDLLGSMNKEYEQLLADYDAFLKGVSPDPLMKEYKEGNLESLRQKILGFEQKAQELISKKQAELITPIIDSIKFASKVVAKAKGFTQILDVSNDTMVYNANGSDDITNAVLAYMRKRPFKLSKS